ncbi:MAG TPA: T9SS type A sorting domain-containing protein [Flavipsychrobacter sp.]|nr:T9SS type A sorting domain-containing protein [Flavipsychrobacter sp.]
MKAYISKFVFAITVVLGVTGSAVNAQPVNDDCSGATTLVHGAWPVYYRDSAANATASMGDGKKDVWYTFTATSDILFIRMTNSPMKYEVYSGSCGNLALLNSEEPIGGFCADLPDSTLLVPGQTYYLRIYFTSTINYQPFHLCLLTRHVYDECGTAPALDMNYNNIIDSLVFGSMMYGRVTTQTPMAYPFVTTGGEEDIWFKFTATDTAHTVFLGSTAYISCWTTSYGYLYAKYNGCTPADTVSPLVQVPIMFDSPGYINFNSLTIGSDYYVRLWTNKMTGVSADFFVGVGPLGATGQMPPPMNVHNAMLSKKEITIYPNPAISQIRINGVEHDDAEVVIFDVTGRMKVKLPYKDDVTIDVSQYSPGIYFVNISGGGTGQAYFVKE